MISADRLPLEELGEHFIVGIGGTDLTPEERSALSRLRPLGVILFAKNFDRSDAEWQSRTRALVDELRDATGRRDLLLAVDHEGGRVHRFPDPVTRFPAAHGWKERAADVARAMATELRALGFNLSFAPVLDVWSEPLNKVIGERAFSTDPELVGRHGSSYLTALEAHGVVGCIKHFPGHGATVADSHEELPRLDATKELLLEREIVPFARLIREGAMLVMTAHVMYPALDPHNPGTLSSRILEDLLRKELGFAGAVITDDLEMRALATMSPEERGVRAFNAGAEILLEANPREGSGAIIALRMAEALRDAVESGVVSVGRMQLARQRMLRFRGHAKSVLCRVHSEPPLDVVGCAEHRSLAESIG